MLEIERSNKVKGSGDLKGFSKGAKISVYDASVLMIIISDNTATNLIIDACGGAAAVNKFIKRCGLEKTRLIKKCGINYEKLLDEIKESPQKKGELVLRYSREFAETTSLDLIKYLTYIES